MGIAAFVIIAALLPKDKGLPEASDWRADLRAIGRLPVILGLATTVFGYAGVFTVFTYIAPLLTQVAMLPDSAVSPILLVFGGGMIIGNILGGKLADRNLGQTLTITLVALGLSLALMPLAFTYGWSSVLIVGLTGIAAFATVAPLQMWVMGKAKGAGEVLVSSFNIAAFNLGNALGAWAGGYAIDHGPGLSSVPYVAVIFPVLAVLVAWLAMRGSRDTPGGTVARPSA